MRKYLFWSLLSVATATLVAAPDQKSPKQEVSRTRVADGFDFPVGKPNAEGYYKARGFRPNGHLGEDWNGVGGGNSDLGDPIYSMGHGLVVFARDVRLGWGNVVIIRHVFNEKNKLVTVDSLYGHLDRITVKEGQQVLRGQLVGTMGTNRGMYPAHLHFEVHKNIKMGITRNGFKHDYTNYYSPTEFINVRRKLSGGGRTTLVAINTYSDSRTFGPPAQGRAPMKPGSKAESDSGRNVIVAPKNSSKKVAPSFRVDRFGDLENF